MSDNPTPQPPAGDQPSGDAPKSTDQPKPETFDQAAVDRIVRERVQRERAKYADYDDLKKAAEGAKTLEDRVADMERRSTESEVRALRAEVANAKGLTPTQAKRLVGSTREELEADADELLTDIGAQRSKNNVVPDEGKTPKNPGGGEKSQFARELFGSTT